MDSRLTRPPNRIDSWRARTGHGHETAGITFRTTHAGQLPLTATFKSSEPHIHDAQKNGFSLANIPDVIDNHFVLDLELLKRSNVLGRLGGITQVFQPHTPEITSRLMHSQDVASIASEIARRLDLNPVLAGAIALGHDCGHGPGGHVFEQTVSDLYEVEFDHGPEGSRLLTQYSDLFHPEVIDGIANHSWKNPTPKTPEADVVSWADRISYIVSDFLDGQRLGFVTFEQLEDDPNIDPALSKWMRTNPDAIKEYFINKVVQDSLTAGFVAMNTDDANKLLAIREFNATHLICSDHRIEQDNRFSDAIIRVFEGVRPEHVRAKNETNIPAGRANPSSVFPPIVGKVMMLEDGELLALHKSITGRNSTASAHGELVRAR